VQAKVLQALGVDYVDESEVLTPADAIALVCRPGHLSTLTQAAAIAALRRHTGRDQVDLAMLAAERERVSNALRAKGFDVVPSYANFILFGRFPDCAVAWERLLDLGVLVSDPGRRPSPLCHHRPAPRQRCPSACR
jgi:histidinol-phosphate/aromatic aminotransferase/cobyric acid decarboxylase-like protein